jgi:hypothetical protein
MVFLIPFFKITNLQKENQQLRIKLNEIQELCFLCSTKLNANICLIQDEISKPNLNNNDVAIAVAALKQVRKFFKVKN